MKKQYLKYFLGLFIYGSNGIISSYIELPSHDIVLLRSLLGSLLLVGIYFFSGKRFRVRGRERDLLFVALSGMAMAADWLLLFHAYTHIGVGLATIINYTGPVIVMIFSALFLGERLNRRQVAALGVALMGAFLITGKGGGTLDFQGLLSAGLSAFAYAALVLLNKGAKKVEGLENATIQLVTSFLTVALFVGMKGGFTMDFKEGDLLPILVLGILNTGIASYLYFSSIGKLSVKTVSICGYLEPFSATVLSVLILKEPLSPIKALGGGMILGGSLLGELKKTKAPKAPKPSSLGKGVVHPGNGII